MKAKNAEMYVEKGKRFLEESDYRSAEKAFTKALELEEAVPIRNNLALAIFMAGEPRRALKVLEPYVDPENKHYGASPFSHALAARIYCSLDRQDLARRQLQAAVHSFDFGLAELRRGGQKQELRSFQEYTVIIMRAAGDLEEHRLVFDLYRRWESHHLSWENKYMAAVACFNIGRYKRAASLWSSIVELWVEISENTSVLRLFAAMKQVASLVERGIIPPFRMGYDLYSNEKLEEMLREAGEKKEARYRYLQDGLFRMVLLSFVLDENNDNQSDGETMHILVSYGGEWGEELGKHVLASPAFSRSLKIAAAGALVARGVYKEDEPIPMYIEGEHWLVEIKKIPVTLEADEELDQVVDRAIKLKDEGKIDEAIDLLHQIYMKGKAYPPALMTLANLLRMKGKLDESYQIMKILEEIKPDSPVLLFNLSSLMLQMNRPEEARIYMERIDTRETDEEFRDMLRELKKEVKRAQEEINPLGAYR